MRKRVLHLHPYDAAGRETRTAEPCAAALRAVQVACPGIPISLSTAAASEPDPRRRELVAVWTLLPELVTANQGEAGIHELCDDVIARGVGIEAGLLSRADADSFVRSGLAAVRSGLAARCVRVLIEPLDPDAAEAVAHAHALEEVLQRAGSALPQVHHGDGIASWAVNARAAPRTRHANRPGGHAGLAQRTASPGQCRAGAHGRRHDGGVRDRPC